MFVSCCSFIVHPILCPSIRSNLFSEGLSVKLDGTFKQTVSLGTNAPLSLSRTWTNEYKRVSFDQLYITYDTMNRRAMNPPEIYHSVYLRWEKDLLIKGENGDYLFYGRRY